MMAKAMILGVAMAMLAAAAHADGATVSVPVLAQPVAANTRIDAGMIVMKDVPANSVFAGTVRDADALTGVVATRKLAAGVPLTKLQIKPASDVQMGGLVNLVFRAPGVELAGSGQALQAGRIGDSIRVLNPSSRATVVGTVIAANTVEVKTGTDMGDAQ